MALRRLFAALLAVLAAVSGTAKVTTAVGATGYTYDVPVVASVDTHQIEAAARPILLSDAHEWSASPPATAQGTSTTPVVASVATNTAKPMGELANPSFVNNAGSPIRSFVTKADTTYYRVYSGDRTVGGFLTGAPPARADDAVRGLALSPANRADFIQEVTVPAGTRLQSSITTRAFARRAGCFSTN